MGDSSGGGQSGESSLPPWVKGSVFHAKKSPCSGPSHS